MLFKEQRKGKTPIFDYFKKIEKNNVFWSLEK